MLILLKMSLVLWGILTLISLFQGWHKGQLKYGFKKAVNGLRSLVHLIGACYIFLGGVTVLPAIIEWQNKQIAIQANDVIVFLLSMASVVWLIAMIGTMCWFIGKGSQPWIKYDELELLLQKQSKDRFLSKMPKVLQGILK